MPTARWLIWVRNASLLLVIVTFVAFFGLPSGDGAGGAVVAIVDDEEIPRDNYEFFREQTASRVEAALGTGAERRLLDEIVDTQTREGLIQRYVLGAEARALGFEVSDAELLDDLRKDERFRVSGRFDKEGFERVAARSFGTTRAYLEELRRDLYFTKFLRLLQSPLRVADADVRDAVERDLLQLRLRFAAARPAEIRATLSISPDEVRAFADGQSARVQQAYQQRRSEFETEEAVRARHVLLRGEKAEERALEALARIRGGEDFAKVAKDASEDLATREDGGDLGFFPRGRMAEAFEQVAFSLEPGKVSEPVETEHGWHIVEVTERRTATTRPLAEVRDSLAEALLRDDRAREQSRRQADALAARLSAGEEFGAAAAAAGLRVEETPVFHPGERMVPGIGRIPGVLDEALSLSPEKPASATVFETGDGLYLIALLERKEPDSGAVAAALPAARERLELEARTRLQQSWYRTRRDALQRDGRIQFFDLRPEG